jgi:CRP-like cAMP-binding protein
LTDLTALHRLAAFAHFSESQIELLGDCSDRFQISAGDTLYAIGDLSYETYAVAGGEIRIRRGTPLGELEMWRVGVGRLVGEMGLLDDRGRHNDAVAKKETDVWVFPRDALRQLADSDHRFGQALYWSVWKSLSTKLRERNQALQDFFAREADGSVQAAGPEPVGRGEVGGDPVDLAAKRGLFQEQPLSNLEVAFLSSLSGTRRLESGETIFREGDAGDAMYIVLEGKVVISKFLEGAGVEALSILERGEFFGEMALIDEQPRSADASAHEDGAVVLAIPPAVLGGLLDIHRVSSLRLLRILCRLIGRRLRSTDEKLFSWYMMAGGDLSDGFS